MNDPMAITIMQVVACQMPVPDRATTLSLDASLLDLGFDSLSMPRLATALEAALGIPEFPLQAWADEEAQLDGKGFTLRSLVAACGSVLRASETPT